MVKTEKPRPGLAIAVTGGIACGKSEVGRILATEGANVCDADEVAHRQMSPGQSVFDRVVARFGPGILDEAGRVDRGQLAKLVFEREDERAALNAITHPPVLEEIDEWAALTKARGKVAVAMIPLLFEVGAEKNFDVVICVAADEKVVLRRLQARGLNENDARKRLMAQWPLAEKIKRAEYVIYNDGGLTALRESTKKVYQAILKKERDEHG